MPDDPDWFARGLGAASFLVAGAALWLNWQKNTRDLAAQRPQFALVSERRGARLWRVKLTVMNPRSVPMAWRKVEVIAPRGARLVSPIARQRNTDERYPDFDNADLSPYVFVEGYPRMIEPNKTELWEGWVKIDEWYGVARSSTPYIIPVIDSYDMRPNLFRRAAKWIWPGAIKM